MQKKNTIKIFLMTTLFAININPIMADSSYSANVDPTLKMIEQQMQKFSTNEQIKKYTLFINIMKNAQNKTKKQAEKEKYWYIAEFFTKKKESLQNQEPEKTNIININQTTIQDKRLDLHNKERKSLGLNKYTINQWLQNTAQKRANYLAEKNSTIWLHKRNIWDGYYNYESIKQRFKDNWVEFPIEQNWIANFSENIARQTFKCNQTDCTDYFLWQTNKAFQFFMSEKSKLWSHYRAIISAYFQEIWVWYAKNWDKFFIVTHYWKFK
jgi:uncharacterized protein YkwD